MAFLSEAIIIVPKVFEISNSAFGARNNSKILAILRVDAYISRGMYRSIRPPFGKEPLDL